MMWISVCDFAIYSSFMKSHFLKSLLVIGIPSLLLLGIFFFTLNTTGCGESCRPSCRSGFVCVSEECVTVCNPECDSGETCNEETGECESESTETESSTESETESETATETETES